MFPALSHTSYLCGVVPMEKVSPDVKPVPSVCIITPDSATQPTSGVITLYSIPHWNTRGSNGAPNGVFVAVPNVTVTTPSVCT